MGKRAKVPVRRSAVAISLIAILVCTLPAQRTAVARYNPDWPCQQIKVPTISLPAVWSGPSIDGLSSQWTSNPDVAGLVAKLAARRTPLEEAQRLIDVFGDKAGKDKREWLLLAFAGVFDELNHQRDEVMSGLVRYSHRQAEFADSIRTENHDFLDLRDRPDSDPAKIKELSDKLDWDMRIYDDRQRSIGFACEVPTLIEQRLFAIARMIEAKLD
jgi:hypothetical protein